MTALQERICADLRAGLLQAAIAKKFGRTCGRVSQIAVSNGLRRRETRRRQPEQRSEIVALRERGMSFDEIAAALGLNKNIVAGQVFRARQARARQAIAA